MFVVFQFDINLLICNGNAVACAQCYIFQLTYVHCICVIDTLFDIDDTAGNSCFTRLTYGFTYRNNAIIAITSQDISLFYLAGIAKSGGVLSTRYIRIVTNG